MDIDKILFPNKYGAKFNSIQELQHLYEDKQIDKSSLYKQMKDFENIVYKTNKYDEYPFNLISNLKDNIIKTKKEIELQYVNDYLYVKNSNKKGRQEDNYIAEIIIYEY